MKVNLCFPRRDINSPLPYIIYDYKWWRMKEINLIPKKVVLQYVLYNRQEFYIIIIISHNNNNTNIKSFEQLKKKKLGKRGIFFFIVLFNFILSCVLSMRICEWVCPYFFCIRLILSYENINHFFFNSGFFFYSSNYTCVWARGCVLLWVRVSCCSWRRLYPISFLYE